MHSSQNFDSENQLSGFKSCHPSSCSHSGKVGGKCEQWDSDCSWEGLVVWLQLMQGWNCMMPEKNPAAWSHVWFSVYLPVSLLCPLLQACLAGQSVMLQRSPGFSSCAGEGRKGKVFWKCSSSRSSAAAAASPAAPAHSPMQSPLDINSTLPSFALLTSWTSTLAAVRLSSRSSLHVTEQQGNFQCFFVIATESSSESFPWFLCLYHWGEK